MAREHNTRWVTQLTSELTALDYHVPPSVANFVLVDFGSEEKANAANQYLLSNHVIIRQMHAYGLPNYLRMTIGTDAENEKLLSLLREWQ